jgi:hypothetical protein
MARAEPGRRAAAVERVSRDRVADVCQVGADLVPVGSMNRDLQ